MGVSFLEIKIFILSAREKILLPIIRCIWWCWIRFCRFTFVFTLSRKGCEWGYVELEKSFLFLKKKKLFQRVCDGAESVSTIWIPYLPSRVGVVNKGLGVSLCKMRKIVFFPIKKYHRVFDDAEFFYILRKKFN